MPKKIFGILAIFTLLAATVFTPAAKAQEGKWYAPTYEEFTRKVFGAPDSQIFGERYTMAQVFWIVNSIPHVVAGSEVGQCMSNSDPLECMEGLTAQGQIDSPLLAIASLSDTTMSVRPASGVEYIANTASDLNIIPQASAQVEGFGFQTLAPALPLWRAVRNFSYGLLTLVVLVFAFMIMFRVKINPQTAITIQSALPKIVIALLLITFSYAIAGLLVDLIYVVMGLISLLFTSSGISNLNAVEFFRQLVAPAPGHALQFALLFLIVASVLGVIAGGAGLLLGVVTGGAGFVIGGAALIFLVLGIVVLFIALVRIFWMLLKSYVTVLLLIIVSPFLILFGTMSPQGGVGGWIRNILANLAVFPLTAALIALANFFLIGSLPGDSPVYNLIKDSNFFNPYKFNAGLIEGASQFPGWGTVGVGWLLGLLAGFAIVVTIPSIVNMIKEMLKIPSFQYGTALDQALRPTPLRMGAGMLAGRYQGKAEYAATPSGAQTVGEKGSRWRALSSLFSSLSK